MGSDCRGDGRDGGGASLSLSLFRDLEDGGMVSYEFMIAVLGMGRTTDLLQWK